MEERESGEERDWRKEKLEEKDTGKRPEERESETGEEKDWRR